MALHAYDNKYCILLITFCFEVKYDKYISTYNNARFYIKNNDHNRTIQTTFNNPLDVNEIYLDKININ